MHSIHNLIFRVENTADQHAMLVKSLSRKTRIINHLLITEEEKPLSQVALIPRVFIPFR